jgi:UV radiation resistance-associated gene protein
MSQPSLLPSNTLVVRLAPNADLYYLPGGQRNMSSFPVQPSRPPSPLAGYSDTEVSYTATGAIRRGKRRSSLPLRPDLVDKSLRETRMKKSAGFGDLLKYGFDHLTNHI